MLVLIKRNIGASMVSEIEVEKIFSVRWDQESGGYHKRHAGYSLYGYIDYELGAGLVDCSGRHGRGNNAMKVMIPASLNKTKPYREGYDYLAYLAGPKPECYWSRGEPCTNKILKLLDNGPMERKPLRDLLIEKRYRSTQIAGALKRLSKDGRIVLHGSPNSPHQLVEKVTDPQKTNIKLDKEKFFENIKLRPARSMFDSNIIRLEAIKAEADKALDNKDAGYAVQLYKWFINEYESSCRIWGDLGDIGYSDAKTKLEKLEWETKE